MGCGQKSFMLVWLCHEIRYGLLANGHLSRVSRQSRLLANGNGDNEEKPGTVHRSPGVYLVKEEEEDSSLMI